LNSLTFPDRLKRYAKIVKGLKGVKASQEVERPGGCYTSLALHTLSAHISSDCLERFKQFQVELGASTAFKVTL
jgi:hypothetical protein